MSLAMRNAKMAQGDPGLFSFVGKALGAVSSILPGPLGIIGKTVGGLLAPKPISVAKQSVGVSMVPGGRMLTSVAPKPLFSPVQQQQPFSGVKIGPGGVAIGTSYAAPAPSGGMTGALLGAGQGTPCTAGYHYNKAAYYSTKYGVVAKGSVCVKNRRRNPLNPRALSRAMSRVKSAQKAVRCLQLFAGPAARASSKARPFGGKRKSGCNGKCR